MDVPECTLLTMFCVSLDYHSWSHERSELSRDCLTGTRQAYAVPERVDIPLCSVSSAYNVILLPVVVIRHLTEDEVHV